MSQNMSLLYVDEILVGEIKPVGKWSESAPQTWCRKITLTGRDGTELELTIHGRKETDIMLPHELDERVTLAERAAHDDKEEAEYDYVADDLASDAARERRMK